MAGLNWPGLLAWSTKYHDGTAPSEFQRMTEEDRRFLEQAMEQAFGMIEDPNQIMREARDQIVSESRTDESITTALEVIDRSCDDADCARNAEKLDVVQPLLDLLKSHRGAILTRTLEILALLFSNNPNIQEAGVKRGAEDSLLTLAQESPQGSEERSKAFRALVALVRNVQEFEKHLLQQEPGQKLLLTCLQLEELPGTREKAASFVRSLVDNGSLEAQYVAPIAASIAELVSNLKDGSIQYKETVSSCAGQLAAHFKAECPEALAKAVESRVAELSASKDPEAENEASILGECLQALKA